MGLVNYFRRDTFLTDFSLAFFLAGFLLADLAAALATCFLADERPLPPPKMFSQLSEYCLLAPTRVIVMGSLETPQCLNRIGGNIRGKPRG